MFPELRSIFPLLRCHQTNPSQFTVEALSHNLIYVTDKTRIAAATKQPSDKVGKIVLSISISFHQEIRIISLFKFASVQRIYVLMLKDKHASKAVYCPHKCTVKVWCYRND
ncbi:hypothetical protein F2P81_001669 [Scophthalmus maximus]|uniref:Uncharacterized protein n=1 Tax=Scophthalmus maximus TaxID=52904 RepID=A0A6A4TNH0_SCOMX|nr:hypothetical protein F2P81_001669 [Scophthalmus maximus]